MNKAYRWALIGIALAAAVAGTVHLMGGGHVSDGDNLREELGRRFDVDPDTLRPNLPPRPNRYPGTLVTKRWGNPAQTVKADDTDLQRGAPFSIEAATESLASAHGAVAAAVFKEVAHASDVVEYDWNLLDARAVEMESDPLLRHVGDRIKEAEKYDVVLLAFEAQIRLNVRRRTGSSNDAWLALRKTVEEKARAEPDAAGAAKTSSDREAKVEIAQRSGDDSRLEIRVTERTVVAYQTVPLDEYLRHGGARSASRPAEYETSPRDAVKSLAEIKHGARQDMEQALREIGPESLEILRELRRKETDPAALERIQSLLDVAPIEWRRRSETRASGPAPTTPPAETRGTKLSAALRIEGVVRDALGNPVAGARVDLYGAVRRARAPGAADREKIRFLHSVFDSLELDAWDNARTFSALTAAGPPTVAGLTPRARDTTRADGKFSIRAPGAATAKSWRLSAAKKGVGAATAQHVEAGKAVELRLGTSLRLEGIVVAETGAPQNGATLLLEGADRLLRTVTDASGKYVFESVEPGPWSVIAWSPGRPPAAYPLTVDEGLPTPLPALKLSRGATLRVRALIPDANSTVRGQGRPIRDVHLIVYHDQLMGYADGVTNDQGAVEFPGMPPGEYRINGVVAGFVSCSEVLLFIRPDETHHEDFLEFEEAVDTRIDVVDEDGRPVQGVEFYVCGDSGSFDLARSQYVGMTDVKGCFVFAFESCGPRSSLVGIKAGGALVRAEPKDYMSGAPMRLTTTRPVRVHGRVATAAGGPASRARVELGFSTRDDDFLALQLVTDDAGAYEFAGLPRAAEMWVSAEERASDLGPEADPTEIVLEEAKWDYRVDLVVGASQELPPSPPK